MIIDKTDWASAAGLIESDGSVGLYKRKSIYTPTGKERVYVEAFLVMTSTDLSTLNWFKKKFGGSIVPYRYRNKNPKRFHAVKKVYNWTINRSKFTWFLSHILPYIRSKNKYKRVQLTLKQRQLVESNLGTGKSRKINYWNLYKKYKREVQ